MDIVDILIATDEMDAAETETETDTGADTGCDLDAGETGYPAASGSGVGGVLLRVCALALLPVLVLLCVALCVLVLCVLPLCSAPLVLCVVSGVVRVCCWLRWCCACVVR